MTKTSYSVIIEDMRLFISALSLLFLLSTNAWCDTQYCPKTLIVTDSFAAPAGWNITFFQRTAKEKTVKLKFHIAEYNYDHKVGANNNRISCLYRNGENTAIIELTSDQDNLPSPRKTGSWEDLDPTSLYCFPRSPVNPDDCPWG